MTPVTVYSKPGCGGCRATKAFLTKKGADFSYVDITQSDDARDQALSIIAEHGLGSQMPLVVAGNGVWTGFRDDKLQEALAS